jgi:biotin carboxylase
MSDKKYVLFIGMGDWDTPQLEIAKSHGLKSVVTNRNPKALALAECDIPIVCDGNDISSILISILHYNLQNQIKFIYTGTELFLTTATIAKIVGVPWHSAESSYISEHKHLMRECFQKGGVKAPHGISVSSFQEFDLKSKTIESPQCGWIFKPSDSLSSQGISIAENSSEWKMSFDYAMSYSKSKVVVCEEYIQGTLHDINGIISKNRMYPMGINDKKAGPPPRAVVIEGRAPTSLDSNMQFEYYSIFEKACRAVGLSEGPVKGDAILTEEGNLYIMEVAPRLHGPLGSLYLIPGVYGINPFEELCHYYLNLNIQVHNPLQASKKSLQIESSGNYSSRDKKNIIKVLRKSGLKDEKKWESNNDVPIYVVKETNNK